MLYILRNKTQSFKSIVIKVLFKVFLLSFHYFVILNFIYLPSVLIHTIVKSSFTKRGEWGVGTGHSVLLLSHSMKLIFLYGCLLDTIENNIVWLFM